ncbi:ABC transporter permease subunit [Cereibacter sphaeroides]|nr:ABC transporter permease subunit [Cereibacter sphaeroides]
MRLTDAQLSIPMIILAITILGVSRPTIPSIILVLGLAGWPVYARVMRSTVMSERKKEYVRGAMVLGATDLRIMFTLLLPLVLPPMAFVAVLDIARMMIFESVLGFLGLGVQPPTPTFGNVIADGRKYLMNAWWIATMPGVFLVLTLTSINLMGASLEIFNDPMPGNFMVGEDGSILLIDYEYASMNDRCYDFGLLFGEMFFTPEQELELIEAYFGEVRPEIVSRVILHKALADVKWALWSMVQLRVSRLAFDFHKYGMWKLMRFRQITGHQDWPKHLRTV